MSEIYDQGLTPRSVQPGRQRGPEARPEADREPRIEHRGDELESREGPDVELPAEDEHERGDR